MIPLSTARTRLIGSATARLGAVQYIMIKVEQPEQLIGVEDEIRSLLRQRHALLPEAGDDFTVRNLADVQASREAASGVLTFWLSAVASVSLVVGGISIMNIMLVSVTERTREIGLRRAVGARASDIRTQFLAEAVILSLIGAVVGLVVGIGAAFLIAAVQELPILVRAASLVAAAGFSLAVGVFFGLYPAIKASQLTPVDALRAE
jgi:putative ABC transport system permease protein